MFKFNHPLIFDVSKKAFPNSCITFSPKDGLDPTFLPSKKYIFFAFINFWLYEAGWLADERLGLNRGNMCCEYLRIFLIFQGKPIKIIGFG
jgi:hypothetical protein